MKNISKIILASALTLLCACGKDQPAPSPSPVPGPTPGKKPSEAVAGTYDCYFATDALGLTAYTEYSDGVKAVFTATGDNTVDAKFTGTGFSSAVTENFELSEDMSGYLMSCISKKAFDYGNFDTSTNHFTIYVKSDIIKYTILKGGEKMPEIFKVSGEHSCSVDEEPGWNRFCVNCVVTNTVSICVGRYYEEDGVQQKDYIRVIEVPCAKGGVLSGRNLEARYKVNSKKADVVTANVTGTITSPTSFNVRIEASNGRTFTVKSTGSK